MNINLKRKKKKRKAYSLCWRDFSQYPPPPGDKHKPDLHTENDFSKLVLLSDTHGQAGPDINSTEYV